MQIIRSSREIAAHEFKCDTFTLESRGYLYLMVQIHFTLVPDPLLLLRIMNI